MTVTVASRLGHINQAVIGAVRRSEIQDVIPLGLGLPSPELFPLDAFEAATSRVLAGNPTKLLQYSQNEGLPELREWVASNLGTEAATAVEPSNIVVTHGSQQGLDLIAKAVIEPGDVVAVENPGYFSATSVFSLFGARLLGLPVDGDGMDVDYLEARLQAGLRLKLLYTVPNFQNPTGSTLTRMRRLRLAELAQTWGFLIIEDDPYGELRFRGASLPGLMTMCENVARLGSFSKVLFPGLRIGYVVAPSYLTAPLIAVKQLADLHTSGLDQAIALELVGDTHFFSQHRATLIDAYRRQCRCLERGLRERFPNDLAFRSPDGGMFLWARLNDPGITAEHLLERAVLCGVSFLPGSTFYVTAPDRHTMRLTFSSLAAGQLKEATRRLRIAFDQAAEGPPALP